MAYPTSTDSFPTLSDGQPAFAAYFNNIHTALVAIETALGNSPQGSYATVAAALAAANTTPGATGPTGVTGPSGASGVSSHLYQTAGSDPGGVDGDLWLDTSVTGGFGPTGATGPAGATGATGAAGAGATHPYLLMGA